MNSRSRCWALVSKSGKVVIDTRQSDADEAESRAWLWLTEQYWWAKCAAHDNDDKFFWHHAGLQGWKIERVWG